MGNTKTNTKQLTICGLLTAIIVLMAFTPIGYLKMPGLEITFITIPVIVGAVILGKGSGAFLGAVFGITSFLQCFGFSAFGQQLLAINPIFTFIVCFLPRVLMGYCCGLIFSLLSKHKKGLLPFAAASLSGALLNTLFFMTALILLFGHTEYIQSMMGENSIITFILLFVGINGAVEAVVCALVGTAISRAVFKSVRDAG